jgi:hypothetical protein
MALIIDGKALAKEVRGGLKQEVGILAEKGVRPGQAVVSLGISTSIS